LPRIDGIIGPAQDSVPSKIAIGYANVEKISSQTCRIHHGRPRPRIRILGLPWTDGSAWDQRTAAQD
ncbi:hypothetical protein AVEN_87968-2-1, partial [Araneus ventricosus]